MQKIFQKNLSMKIRLDHCCPKRILLVVLMAIFYVSCADPNDQDWGAQTNISFTIATSQEWGTSEHTPTTRTEYKNVPSQQVFVMTDYSGGKPLYLHTITTDSIQERTDNSHYDLEKKQGTTRATPITSATLYPSFGVFGYVYDRSDSWNESLTSNYMYNTEVGFNTNWKTNYKWPGPLKKIRFFAYAPYSSEGIVLPSITSSGSPFIFYKVPVNVSRQKDILVASSQELPGNANSNVNLNFCHILTAVRFVTGDQMMPGKIKKITLKGVYGKGTYYMGTDSWRNLGGNDANPLSKSVDTFEQIIDKQLDSQNNIDMSAHTASNQEITSYDATFMMLPQILPLAAEVEVTFVDNLTSTERILKASLGGSTWKMGCTVTYRISSTSIMISPRLTVQSPAAFSPMGGNQNYTVESYAIVSSPNTAEQKIALPWNAEFSIDGGISWSASHPSWLNSFTANNTGSTSPTTFVAGVTKQDSHSTFNRDDILRSRSPLGSVYDLSTNGGNKSRSTANCYLVNRAGTYSLPLVYGNAIKDGAVNAASFTSTVNGQYVLKRFLNHLDAPITNPYIRNNVNCSPNNCCLVWEDEPGLITNVSLGADNNTLIFTVPQNTIKQGNAIVAVRDAANNIMWSWHIWVTDYVLGTDLKTVTNYNNRTFTFLPLNVGWCGDPDTQYDERSVLVRIRQTQSGKTQQFLIKQRGGTLPGFGNNPYYQWGRKDPMLAGIRNGVDKTCFTDQNNKNYAFSVTDGKASLGKSISHPYQFYTYSYRNQPPDDWCSDSYYNTWDANNMSTQPSENGIVKTIYDPSPVGYCVPPSNAFSGFSLTGGYVSQPEQFNVSGSFVNGWTFFGGHNRTGDQIFFPATGMRSGGPETLASIASNSEDTGYNYGYGFYLSATPESTSRVYNLMFYPEGIVILNLTGDRSSGRSVRPIRE